MDGLYLETSNLLQQIHFGLANLERAKDALQANQIESTIGKQLELIMSNCDRLDGMADKEPPAKKRNAKYKADQLKYDCQHLRAAFTTLKEKRNAQFQYDSNRQDLFARKSVHSGNDSTSIYMDDQSLQHHSSLQNSHAQLDNLLDSGSSILENLRHQHVSLKGVKRRILDVTNTLGLSTTVMRLIERRTAQDKVVLLVGMVITSLVMFFFYRWFKS